MKTQSDRQTEELRLDDLVAFVEGKDSLLDAAVKRLRAEEAGEVTNWFKHGQFGSHNSFAG